MPCKISASNGRKGYAKPRIALKVTATTMVNTNLRRPYSTKWRWANATTAYESAAMR